MSLQSRPEVMRKHWGVLSVMGVILISFQGCKKGEVLAARDERLAYVVDAGEELTVVRTIRGGRVVGPGPREIDERVTIDVLKRRIEAERHQQPSDEGGESIGTFEAPLPPGLDEKLRKVLKRVNLQAVGASHEGGPGASTISIKVHGEGDAQVSVSSRDITLLEKLDPHSVVLDDAMMEASHHPVQALRLEVEAHRHGDEIRASLILRNVGSKPVAIADPRGLQPLNGNRSQEGAGVAMAEYPETPPGYTEPPLNWRYFPLVSHSSSSATPVLVLTPNEVRQFDLAPVKLKGRALVQAGLQVYRHRQKKSDSAELRGQWASASVTVR